MKTAVSLELPEDYFAAGLQILTRIFDDYAAFNG